jgi:hypothetical protein
MVKPSAFDDLILTATGGEGDAILDAPYPFNPLTDGLNDLQITHQHCWFRPQIRLELDHLDEVIGGAHGFARFAHLRMGANAGSTRRFATFAGFAATSLGNFTSTAGKNLGRPLNRH